MDYNNCLTHPAYLFIGSFDALIDHTLTLLQKKLCSQKIDAAGCGVCNVCRKVREQQHETIIWLAPEKQYVIDDLKIIGQKLSFALEPNQDAYFVLQQADLLTTLCANALLKSLEEPPAGYHFILLAERFEAILPTIKSRCIIEHLAPEKKAPQAALLAYFTTTAFQDPISFAKELEATSPSEWETVALVDQLLAHWSDIYKKSVVKNDSAQQKKASTSLAILKKALVQPPMPGSSKLFWRNLFLQIKEIA